MGQLIKMGLKGLLGVAIATAGVAVYKACKESDNEDTFKGFKPGTGPYTDRADGFGTGQFGGGYTGQFGGGMGQFSGGPGGYGDFNGAGQFGGGFGGTPKGGFGFNGDHGSGQFAGGYCRTDRAADRIEYKKSDSLKEAKSRFMHVFSNEPEVVLTAFDVVNDWSKRGIPEGYSIDFLDRYTMGFDSIESFMGEYGTAAKDKESFLDSAIDKVAKAKDKITSPLTTEDLEKLSNKTGGIITDCDGKPKVDWDKAERASLEKVSDAVEKLQSLLNNKLGK